MVSRGDESPPRPDSGLGVSQIAKWLGVDDGDRARVRRVYEQKPARKAKQPTRTGGLRLSPVYEVRIAIEPWNEAQGEPQTRREVA